MERSEWLNRLEALHDRLREGEPVGEADVAWYQAARRALLERALEVESRCLVHGAVRRRDVRVARAAEVLLEAPGWSVRTLTVDLGAGGLAVLLEGAPPVDDWIRATLLLPDEAPIVATVSVADAHPHGGLLRVSLRFAEPSDEVHRRVEDFLMDGVLSELVFWDDVLDRLRP